MNGKKKNSTTTSLKDVLQELVRLSYRKAKDDKEWQELAEMGIGEV